MNPLEIHDKALSIIDPESRREYLDQACGGDSLLRGRVEAMLGISEFPPDDDPPNESAGPGHGDTEESESPRGRDRLLGQSVGGVKLVRLINKGGMGRVYEGRQAIPRRAVAVKLVKEALATPKMLRRFEFEAQILARLTHPGIAQIFAAGTAGEGETAQPYFVMEYIANAKPITQYAKELKLPTHARLELFRKVCDAVAYGHQRGIIHRDLKPENILVDASGQPKVIDFGIAKTTDSDMALTTVQTDVGRLIGTYQYMSPEQFDADPHAIDVRSDVYALGVVLYELLSGQHPYDLKKRILPEIAAIVREHDPTPITNINKTLRKDVGIIAGKCLEKDRNRRYSSASELAADVGRFLAGDPIAAVAPSLWDGLGRLARRHKAAAAAMTGIAASLVAAMIGISLFAIRAGRERVEADRARQAAEEAGKAEAEQVVVANEARRAAETARQAEAEQRRLAESETLKANRLLYKADLWRLDSELAKPQRTFAKQAFRDAKEHFRDAYGETTLEPIELTVLRTELDGAIAVFEGHEESVTSVAFSPDGSRLATASADGTARLWDAMTGQPIAIVRGHGQRVASVAFSPDGSLLATGSQDGSIRLRKSATGTTLRTLEGHENGISSIAFSPDGSRLATGSSDKTCRLWDTATGESLAVVKGHGAEVASVAFSPDGSRLATGSTDKTVRLWGLSNAEVFRNRRSSAERRGRLGPIVDEWLTGDPAAVKASLQSARDSMPADDWRVAANLVLMRVTARGELRHQTDPSSQIVVDLTRRIGLDPEICAGIDPDTRSLNFWGTPLTAAHVAALPPIPSLDFLNLGFTGLQAGDLHDLARFPRLERLHLEFLVADGNELAMLAEVGSVTFLSLWNSSVGNPGARTALRLPNLEHLDLGGTRIEDGLFDGIVPNDSLRELILDQTALTDRSIDALCRWRSLTTLDLTGAAFSPAGKARLRAALPGCTIVTDSQR